MRTPGSLSLDALSVRRIRERRRETDDSAPGPVVADRSKVSG
jgi:hypothetical protein